MKSKDQSLLEEAYGKMMQNESDELISKLEKMSEVITSNKIDNEFVNIANKVLGLLKGVDPYSKNPPKLSPKQRQAAREIGGIILNRPDLV
jgi:hypothetical protein